jgi:hypothetical protein
MESFFHKNKEVAFSSVTGIVLGGQEKRSETHVSSSGGGGYVGKNGGHVSAAQVHSTVTTKHEFWIELEDGTEKAVQLSGCDIPLKEGHKITLVSVNKSKRNREFYTFLVNHNTKSSNVIMSGEFINAVFSIAPVRRVISFILIMVAGFGTTIYTDEAWLGILVGIGAYVALMGYYGHKEHSMNQLIDAYLERLSTEIIKSGG